MTIQIPVLLTEMLCPDQGPYNGSMFAINGSGFSGDGSIKAPTVLPLLCLLNQHDNASANSSSHGLGAISEEMKRSGDGGGRCRHFTESCSSDFR